MFVSSQLINSSPSHHISVHRVTRSVVPAAISTGAASLPTTHPIPGQVTYREVTTPVSPPPLRPPPHNTPDQSQERSLKFSPRPGPARPSRSCAAPIPVSVSVAAPVVAQLFGRSRLAAKVTSRVVLRGAPSRLIRRLETRGDPGLGARDDWGFETRGGDLGFWAWVGKTRDSGQDS